MSIKLRPYQEDAVLAVRRDWQAGVQDALVVLPTGCGKTQVFLQVGADELADNPDARILIVAHTEELVSQPLERLDLHWPALAMQAGIVQGPRNDVAKRVICATVQSLSVKRLDQILAYGPITHVVVDECFPAGTLIDGQPIETVEPGDRVWAYDGYSDRLKLGRVVRTFRRRPLSLVRVKTARGEVICTPNHPFETRRGWVPAGELTTEDYALAIKDVPGLRQPEGTTSVALPEVRRADGAPGDVGRLTADGLRGMRRGDSFAHQESDGRVVQGSADVLLEGVLVGVVGQGVVGQDGGDESQARLGAHEGPQPDGSAGDSGEDVGHAAGNQARATGAGWQRPPADKDGADDGHGARLADERHRANAQAEAQPGASTHPLQTRPGEPGPDGRGGDRRLLTHGAGSEGTGREEGPLLDWVRVDGVEVLEPGSDGRFGGVCPDGLVYNFEVEGYHTYVANGFVVHNCHHAVAASYVRVLEQLQLAHPGLRHLGVTATPIRSDQRGLVERYKKVSFKYTIKQAIRDGYLCPLKAIGVETGVSLGGVAFRDGDFSREGVASVMDVANVYELVVESYKRWADGRRAIGFFASVEAAHHAADVFNAAGISAAACDGTTPREDRRRILADFKAGKTQVLCNMQLFTEGVDVPEVSCVLYCAPTASQGRYIQAVGRGLRIAPGKADCLILDFLPNELKRVVMAGDLLGRPRQEKEAEEKARERGVVVEAFAEAGADDDGPGIDADPDELVARKLDLLGRGQWRWYYADGWSTLDLGDRGGDGQSKALAIVPVGGQHRLVVEARLGLGEPQPDGRYERYANTLAVLAEGGYEDVLDAANDYADEHASAALAQRGRAWLSDPATEKQLALLTKLERKALPAGLTKGQAGQRTTYWLLRKAVERKGLHVSRDELEEAVW